MSVPPALVALLTRKKADVAIQVGRTKEKGKRERERKRKQGKQIDQCVSETTVMPVTTAGHRKSIGTSILVENV